MWPLDAGYQPYIAKVVLSRRSIFIFMLFFAHVFMLYDNTETMNHYYNVSIGNAGTKQLCSQYNSQSVYNLPIYWEQRFDCFLRK